MEFRGVSRIVKARQQTNEECRQRRLKWQAGVERAEERRARLAKEEELRRLTDELDRLRQEYLSTMARRGLAHEAARLINQQEEEIAKCADRLDWVVKRRAHQTLADVRKTNAEKRKEEEEKKRQQLERRRLMMGVGCKWRQLDEEQRGVYKKLAELNSLERSLRKLIQDQEGAGQNKKSLQTQVKKVVEEKTSRDKKATAGRVVGKEKTLPKVVVEEKSSEREAKIDKSDVGIQTEVEKSKEKEQPLKPKEPAKTFSSNGPIDLPLTIAAKVLAKLKQRPVMAEPDQVPNKILRNAAVNTIASNISPVVPGFELGSVCSSETSYFSLPKVDQSNRQVINTLSAIKRTIVQENGSVGSESSSSPRSSVSVHLSASVTSNHNDESLNKLLERIHHLKGLMDLQLETVEQIQPNDDCVVEIENSAQDQLNEDFFRNRPCRVFGSDIRNRIGADGADNSLQMQEVSRNLNHSPSFASTSLFKTLTPVSCVSPMSNASSASQILSPINYNHHEEDSLFDISRSISSVSRPASMLSGHTISYCERAIGGQDKRAFFKEIFMNAGCPISDDTYDRVVNNNLEDRISQLDLSSPRQLQTSALAGHKQSTPKSGDERDLVDDLDLNQL